MFQICTVTPGMEAPCGEMRVEGAGDNFNPYKVLPQILVVTDVTIGGKIGWLCKQKFRITWRDGIQDFGLNDGG